MAGIVSSRSTYSADAHEPVSPTATASSSSGSASFATCSRALPRSCPSRMPIHSVSLAPTPSGSSVWSIPGWAGLSPAPSAVNLTRTPPAGAGWFSVAVSTTVAPSRGRTVLSPSLARSGPSSRIVISTDDGSPASTDDGSALPSATVNFSSSSSSSRTVDSAPVPLVRPAATVIDASEPMSPCSVVPGSIVSGIVTSDPSARDSVAVTVTLDPSATGFGDAASDTAGACDGVPVPTTHAPAPDAFTARTRTRYSVSFVSGLIVCDVPVTAPAVTHAVATAEPTAALFATADVSADV